MILPAEWDDDLPDEELVEMMVKMNVYERSTCEWLVEVLRGRVPDAPPLD